MKCVTIHQPDFIPWIGFFHRWATSDILIILDDVQYIRRGWQNRDKIKTIKGPQWLTVSIQSKGRYKQKISHVEIDNSRNWRKKILNQIYVSYRTAPNFCNIYKEFEEIINKPYALLIDLNMDFLFYIGNKFGIKTPVICSSQYCLKTQSNQRLIDLVSAVDGSHYLAGLGSKEYLDEKAFNAADIHVQWQNFKTLNYQQLHGEFEPMLSAIDYLMMYSKTDHIFSE